MNDFLRLFETRRMPLIMSLPRNDASLCALAFDAGADAVKVHMNLSHKASGNGFGSLEDESDNLLKILRAARGPVGLVPGADPVLISRDAPSAQEMGFSFFSFYAHHLPASALGMKPALMAACSADYTAEEIRIMPDFGAQILEASVIPHTEYGQRLTMRDLLRYRLIAQASPVPVVVPTQRAILPEDVPYLAQTGIRALMIGAIVTGNDAESIRKAIVQYRCAIDAL